MDSSTATVNDWEQDGISVLPSALTIDEVEQIRSAVDALYNKFLAGEISNYSLDTETATEMPELWKRFLELPSDKQSFRRWNVVADSAEFRSLIDHDRIFSRVVDLMGTDIQLFKSQIIVIPAGIRESPYLHTDAGSMAKMCVTEGSEEPMISVQIFLTDLEQENMGNFTNVRMNVHLRDRTHWAP